MAKKVLYSSTEISGSHTIKWYLDQIFANTGYTYALNFSPAAIEKDNWGNKTRLSLFNDLITSIAGEFEINGTLISIFQNIGTDLSTIVRYGFNLSDMTLENDATSFVTYGEGFGAYADQENQTGDRVHVTYTSPLAGVYGILQAEPIDDQRYTSQANLQAAVKAQVDASFSVSVQLSLYDLTAAGYPYKMANVGDWLTAVDENLDFKQRIRIISIDDEFSADGTRISYTVTAGDIGLTKKYQDANASMSSQIAYAVASASQAATDANNALISANGKNTSYYLNSVDDLPTKANEGDLAWVKSGDGTVMYIYTKKADGSYYWEKRIDPEMGDQIAAGVTDAVAQANAHTDEVKQGLSTDIDTAKSQAASQASTAEANAKSAATSQFNQAQADIVTNANAITQKVSQTDYDKETGDLTTAVSKAQTTADGLAISVGNYKTINDNRVKAAETAIAQNAKGITLRATTSDLNSAKSDLNSSIAQVKITADSISNFVRDSSGNISSDFQTALSKTSIITDSTLATSIQKQTSSQITSALTDNNGKIISLINQDTSGVQIAGKNIILDGNTTVTGDFYAKGGNFTNLNASNMTVGTLNGSQVNITNINANNITTGTISALTLSGLQYSIDLTKGEQKNWYTSGSNTYTTSYYKGDIQFTGSYSDQMAAVINNNPSTASSDPYPVINIGVTDNSASKMSRINIYSSNVAPVTTVDGRKSVKLGSNSSQISSNSQTSGGSLGLEANTIYIGQGVNGSSSAIPAPSLVQIYAATTGTIALNAGIGDFNVAQDSTGGRVWSSSTYDRTYSYPSNMFITNLGTFGRATSASKYKLAITHYDDLDRANKLLSIKPARWFDKAETEQYADELNGGDGYREHLPVKPHFGLIAEDLVEAGLEEFVSYGIDGEVEGLEYERVWTTLIPLIKNMKERIEELESKGK